MNTNQALLCPSCFQDKGAETICPHCGYDETLPRSPLVLPHRTLLQDHYQIGAVLGKPGAFGITYLGFDTRLETLVAIKEYLPRDLVGREADTTTVCAHSPDDSKLFLFGLEQFLNEARTLAQFDNAHVVRVRNVFEENASAYLVMDYYQGISLAEYLEKKQRLPERVALDIMIPILDGLREVHDKGYLHCDIKPQNIFLTREGCPILLDFGAVRVAIGKHNNTLAAVLTPGYAPLELYHRQGEQHGPWTDIYSCAAVLYQIITGKTPPNAPQRAEHDSLQAPITLAPELTPAVNQAILAGLALEATARPQTVQEFQERLRPKTIPAPKQSIYAGFWKRVGATMVDGVIATITFVITIFFIGFTAGLSGLGDAEESLGLLIYALSLLLYWMYTAGLESSAHQATVGKLILGIKVTDLEGRRISFWRASGRYFGKIISSVTLGIGFVMAGFTERKQALHDKIAACLVVDKSMTPETTETASSEGVTAQIWMGFVGLLILLFTWFYFSAKDEIGLQPQSQVDIQQQQAQLREQAQRQQAQLQAERNEIQRRKEALQAEREAIKRREEAQQREAKLQAERAEAERVEAEQQAQLPVRTLVAYYQALGNNNQAALFMWTDAYNRPKLAKLIANVEYAEVKSARVDANDGTFATVWIDVIIKAKNTPQQRWQGPAKLEAVAGRWLISALNGLTEVR